MSRRVTALAGALLLAGCSSMTREPDAPVETTPAVDVAATTATPEPAPGVVTAPAPAPRPAPEPDPEPSCRRVAGLVDALKAALA